MEPTSSPDNARPARGLARFWPVHRETGDETDSPQDADALPGDTQVVALGSRAPGSLEFSFPPAYAETPFAAVTALPGSPGRPGVPFTPFASARDPGSPPDGPQPADRPGASGPPDPPGSRPGQPAPSSGARPGAGSSPGGQHETAGRSFSPSERSSRPSERSSLPSEESSRPSEEEPAPKAVESSPTTPWDRDTGSFGGFGLGGRNGRLLFGGRGPAPGLNGHANGVSPTSPAAKSTGPGQDAREQGAGEQDRPAAAGRSDENGRDDMNGRAGVPGYPTAGDPAPAEDGAGSPGGRRRDLNDAGDPRGQATGWASVPTSTHPLINPTSGAPSSGAPVSASPISPAFAPPAYG